MDAAALLTRSSVALPPVTFKVIAAIHWQGFAAVAERRAPGRPSGDGRNTGLASAPGNDYTSSALPARLKGEG
jgi:hypothetical protein